MEDKMRKEFGEFMRSLRNRAGLSLRTVERETGVSNSYINQIETGTRNPPKPDILRRFATLYGVPLRSLMAAAGLDEQEELDLFNDELERAFQFVVQDPKYKFGMQARGEMSVGAKRFIVEMYQELNRDKNLLSPNNNAGKVEDEGYEDEDE